MGAIARLGLALAIRLLVGFERGWQERNEPDRFAGGMLLATLIAMALGAAVFFLTGAISWPSSI